MPPKRLVPRPPAGPPPLLGAHSKARPRLESPKRAPAPKHHAGASASRPIGAPVQWCARSRPPARPKAAQHRPMPPTTPPPPEALIARGSVGAAWRGKRRAPPEPASRPLRFQAVAKKIGKHRRGTQPPAAAAPAAHAAAARPALIGRRPRLGAIVRSAPAAARASGASSSHGGRGGGGSSAAASSSDVPHRAGERQSWYGPKPVVKEVPVARPRPSTARTMDLATPLQTDVSRLQMRVSWWGFALAEERGSLFEDRLRRIVGILVFSTALAGEEQGFDPTGWRVCKAGSSLKAICHPNLFSSVGVYTQQECLINAGRGRKVIFMAGAYRCVLADGIALAGIKEFCFVAFSVTVQHPTAQLIDPPAEWLAEGLLEGQDWTKDALMLLDVFLKFQRKLSPRILVGHGGQLSIAIEVVAEKALLQHVCFAGYGPSRSREQIDGGVWIVGPHAKTGGSGIACDEHEALPPGVSELGRVLPDDVLPHPRVAVIDRPGFAFGVPTLFLGRSHRNNQKSYKRAPTKHRGERYSAD